jgi:hypothetical protein
VEGDANFVGEPFEGDRAADTISRLEAALCIGVVPAKSLVEGDRAVTGACSMAREDGPCLSSEGPGVKSKRRLDASRIGVGDRFRVEWTLGVCGEERLRDDVFREERGAGERSLLDIRLEVISRGDKCLDGLRAEATRGGSGATSWLVAAPMLSTKADASARTLQLLK